MIVATAKAFGAELFFSHDAECRAMCKFVNLEARDLPDIEPNLYYERLRTGRTS